MKAKGVNNMNYLKYLEEESHYSTGFVKWYKCTKPNKKGETLQIEQHASGSIQTYVRDSKGNESGKYNPTIYYLITRDYSGPQIDREILSNNTKDELLNETVKLFMKANWKLKVIKK